MSRPCILWLQDLFQQMGASGMTWEALLAVINLPNFDDAVIQLLRAITARELSANPEDYSVFFVGIDAYR